LRQAGWWFSQGSPVSSTNKTDRHDRTEILLKLALNTITHNHIFFKQTNEINPKMKKTTCDLVED
jgi:hypothetical protein